MKRWKHYMLVAYQTNRVPYRNEIGLTAVQLSVGIFIALLQRENPNKTTRKQPAINESKIILLSGIHFHKPC